MMSRRTGPGLALPAVLATSRRQLVSHPSGVKNQRFPLDQRANNPHIPLEQ